MKRFVIVLVALLMTFATLTVAAGEPVDGAKAAHTREEVSELTFAWHGAPGWKITDVVFGIRDGSLVFARYVATPPDGVPTYQDHSDEVDLLVDDLAALPAPVRLDVGNGRHVWLDSLSFAADEHGRAILYEATGATPEGEFVQVSPATAANSVCGSPYVAGSCTDICGGTCQPDIDSGDPCVCDGFGGCTTGTARWVCPIGSCTGSCNFVAGLGCGCF